MSVHATITHFAICFPDWNSLDSVRRAHSRLEGLALVSFALLVLFDVSAHLSEGKNRARLLEKIGLCFFALAVLAEIAAYPYGERNDTLSEKIIGSLDAKAREASTNASSALTKAEAADAMAGKAQGKAEAAETSAKRAGILAAQAETDAQNARQDAIQLRVDLKTTEQGLTDEHNKRIELEKSIAPRFILPMSLPQEDLAITDVLKKFTGVHAIVDCIPDWEARRAAHNIIALLIQAGWAIDSTAIVDKDFPDGVSIKVHQLVFDEEAYHAGRSGWPEEEDKARDAGDELIAFLRANDWVAQTDFSEQRVLEPNQLYIKVGFKPAPYFMGSLPTGPPIMPWEERKTEQIRTILKNFWIEQDRVLKDVQHKH